nr:hypothetical protein [Candidatus Baldrarchaeota archaeon]
METIGVLSILEGKPYKVVKKLWKIFEEKYNSVGVQVFSHPNITFQAGETENLKQLKKNFEIAWNELRNKKFRFKQRLHNLCIVKWYPSGKIKIVKKFNLKGVIP